MPTVLIHEEVAYNIAKKYKQLDNKDFYLGALAPDTVNLNGFASKEERWNSHLRNENLDTWLENVKKFYNENKDKYNKYFLLGYVLHIITDIVHDKYFYQDIRTAMTKNNINEDDQHPLLRKYMLEYGYLDENNQIREYINDLLKEHTGYNIKNISKEDLIAWKNKCFSNYNEKVYPNNYITKNHIQELSKKTEEEFKTFIT